MQEYFSRKFFFATRARDSQVLKEKVTADSSNKRRQGSD